MAANNCGSCGATLAATDQFCPSCGADQVRTAPVAETVVAPATQATHCPSCSSPVRPDNAFCPSCGTALADAPTVPAQASLERMTTDRLAEATTGEFEVLQRIGHGAMGSVYLARDVALSRRVAIKVISPQLLQDETMVARFRLEAQTVAALRHPHIVNLHAVRQLGDLHYFIMDFIDGPSLRAVMKAHAPLQIPVAQALLFQVGTALSYAHRRGRGVIHRDVKPANVMVDREGNAVVMDFGISKVGAAQSGLTQTGATIGTPEYMSPEQCMDKELTGASDQYALGIVAYEMLTGAVPFKGSTYAIMMAHAQGTPRSIREQRPDCPEEVEAAVMKMLAKEPGDRFADLEEAVEALGGNPLGQRDPVRDTIVALVTSVSSEEAELDESSPLSPIPPSADRTAAATAPASPPAPASAAPPPTSPPATAHSAAETVLVPETVRESMVAEPSAPAAKSSGGRRWLAIAALIVVALGASQFVLGSIRTNAADEPTPPLADGTTETGTAATAADVTPAVTTEPGEETVAAAITDDDAEEVDPGPVTDEPPVSSPARDDPPPQTTPPPAVPAASVAEIRIAAARPALRVGIDTPAEARALTAGGEAVSDVEITWTSSRPDVARVESGRLSTLAPGATVLTASVDGVSTTAELTVLALPTREESQGILRQFIAPMVRQNVSEVQRRFGRGARGQRQTQILDNIRQASFSAQMAELDDPVPDGPGAMVDFAVSMRWRGAAGQRTEPRTVWFRAQLLPSLEGWVVDEVTPLSR